MVTIPRMVTIQLQPFLYHTQIWLSDILTGQDFGSQISLRDMLPKLNTFDLSLVSGIFLGSFSFFSKAKKSACGTTQSSPSIAGIYVLNQCGARTGF